MNLAKGLSVAVLPCLMSFAQAPTETQAVILVKSAVAFAKQHGMAKLIQETNDPKGRFHVATGGEMYIFMYDERGNCKAIGYNTAALVGTNRIELRDPDGLMIMREMIKLALTKGKGWIDYKYPNPTTGKNDQKTSYLEYYDGVFIGCGVYKEKD
jgi:signal transduction histidine kinase